MNRNNPQRLVIGGADAIWESTDRGDTIVSLAAGANATSMVYGHASNVELLWVGTGTGLLVRTTAGGALAAPPTPFPGGGVRDIIVDPSNANVVYVTSTSRVFRTPDGGTTWNEITGDLAQLVPGTVRAIAFVPGAANGKVFVGSDTGVQSRRRTASGSGTGSARQCRERSSWTWTTRPTPTSFTLARWDEAPGHWPVHRPPTCLLRPAARTC